jgi:gliding motility-associated-like protein
MDFIFLVKINPLSRKLWLLFLFLFSFSISFSQQRCGSYEYMQMLRTKKIINEPDEQFEKWMNENIIRHKADDKVKRIQKSYQVQVVVHIIHNGEIKGVGTNISDAQVYSQIEVLNNDFQRMNSDASKTPDEFQPFAADMPIEFLLAKTDPQGNPTNGINRVKGTQPDWDSIEDNEKIKSLSYWPAENYLNIWVCRLNDRYGIAQFPVSTLPGLNDSSRSRLTDGLSISFEVFGSDDFGNFLLHPLYNKGRTTTHEMGHFFGLRHLWGDEENCKGTDYVDDTPPQANQTLGCPSHPQKECPLDNPQNKMFQNYLDYTDDECMNLFTKGQVERMITVLENSPRRASLLLPLSTEQPTVQFPKLFSPNGDGINDFWLWPNTLDYMNCKLTIFNRFGKRVYEADPYDNSWDGKSSSGQPLEEEAYYYVISCDEKKITGGVRIVR